MTTETRTQHTPEPWRSAHAFLASKDCVLAGGPTYVEGLVNVATGLTPEDANRIVACVNACAGINPEAVPELVRAAQAVQRWAEAGGDDWWKAHDALYAAIAKAEARP